MIRTLAVLALAALAAACDRQPWAVPLVPDRSTEARGQLNDDWTYHLILRWRCADSSWMLGGKTVHLMLERDSLEAKFDEPLESIRHATEPAASSHAGPRNFIFFSLDRERISEPSFLETEAIVGAQLKYTWRELEPQRDRYELGPVLEDLASLEAHGKRLFVQIQDVSFDERINVPQYLVDDPVFGGGVARKYDTDGGEGSRPRFDGWVARRWDPAVIARFASLLQALGRSLDGRIEGINLAETSIGFGDDETLHPAGFSFEGYTEGVKAIMTAAREAFPRTVVIQYANFMPGEWLPWDDRGYLREVYAHAERIGVGVGGPDLLPHRRGQQNHSYMLIFERPPSVVAGLAVQQGNLDARIPGTDQPVTAVELYRFASHRLRLDYLFWATHEPHYPRQILPLLRDLPPPGPASGAPQEAQPG